MKNENKIVLKTVKELNELTKQAHGETPHAFTYGSYYLEKGVWMFKEWDKEVGFEIGPMQEDPKVDYLADERVRLSKFNIADYKFPGNYELKEGGQWPFFITEIFEDGSEIDGDYNSDKGMPRLQIKDGTINKAGLFAQLPKGKAVLDVYFDDEHGGFFIRIASPKVIKQIRDKK